MYEAFGAEVQDNNVVVRLFFPDNAKDASQYQRGGLPRIRRLQVAGDFQHLTGAQDWDLGTAPEMEADQHASGVVWTCDLGNVPDGFYQYKYFATFENGTSRWCTDPCTKYVGLVNQNAGFVVGGNKLGSVTPNQKPAAFPDMVIYELMLDDFTAAYRGNRPAVDAVLDKLDYLVGLGINTVEFMPWTAWRGDDFDWGYDPYLFFSVENRYIEDPADPLNRLFRLQQMIDTLHQRGIGVIMDGVFDHVNVGQVPDTGFAYFWLYQDPTDSPYIGDFAAAGYFQDLDYHNGCTQQFTTDVCIYWLDRYQVDGIRFDYVQGIFDPADPSQGIPKLIKDLNTHLAEQERSGVIFILEDMPDNRYLAIDDTNKICATACWYDRFHWDVPGLAAAGTVDTQLVRVVNTAVQFMPGKGPVTYIENHDHSSVIDRVGGRDLWYKTQPPALALLTCSGAVMLHNGQEFGEDYSMPESGAGRVVPRPLQWDHTNDATGQQLLNLYKFLIQIRHDHPALRTTNFFPWPYDERWTGFNPEGYGVDVDRGILIFHRWGGTPAGQLERFIIAINFSPFDQTVTIPFSVNRPWKELLANRTVNITNNSLPTALLTSNWGGIYVNTSRM
jgi:pullulanase